jgi:ubiquinone/menaquinone biosynthesis C-methylase UbiE
MSTQLKSEVEAQRAYYARTARSYDDMHVSEQDEHGFALAFMISAIEFLGIESILDIGSGTGRALKTIQNKIPHVKVVGIEPSQDLREAGYSAGVSPSVLIDGDAMNLQFPDGHFDLVCEFGALHHIPNPSLAVAEMLRVSKKAIFISDCNNFGQGSKISRVAKQLINAIGLWRAVDFIKTGGKGYTISEGDGLAYSYSVFNDYARIDAECRSVHCLNTVDSDPDLYGSASHVALLGIK